MSDPARGHGFSRPGSVEDANYPGSSGPPQPRAMCRPDASRPAKRGHASFGPTGIQPLRWCNRHHHGHLAENGTGEVSAHRLAGQRGTTGTP